jgi:hypothetical protein
MVSCPLLLQEINLLSLNVICTKRLPFELEELFVQFAGYKTVNLAEMKW